MNLESIQYAYPQILEDIIDCKSHALVCSFNQLGTLLGVGCLDGNILIYDFISKIFSKTIQVHNYLIYSLSWSNESDKLLSCSYDYSICLWSLITNQCLIRLNLFSTLPTNVYFHPLNSNRILINFFQNYSILFNLNDKNSYENLIDNSIESLSTDGWISIFNHNGEYILTGNSQGKLFIFSITESSKKLYRSGYIDQHRNCAIKQICISKQSKYVAILSLDKIRLYKWTNLLEEKDSNEYKYEQILSDNVSKVKFIKMNFSFDEEYLCSASTRQHRLYIWEIYSGSLIKILDYESSKSISDIIWHPIRPIIISISDGILYVWSRSEYKLFPSNFHEIDENIIYHEHENEFDINKSDVSIHNNEEEEEEEFIDINDNKDIMWVSIDSLSDEDEEIIF